MEICPRLEPAWMHLQCKQIGRLVRPRFFARQCSTATFDHVAVAIDFICAIDIDSQASHFLQIHHRNAQGLHPLGRRFGTGDRPLDGCWTSGQGLDEFIHCRACAYAHPFMGDQVMQGGDAYLGFQFVLCQSSWAHR